MPHLFDEVVQEYRRMEPDGADTWNPLHRDRELHHRLVLYEHLCLALRQCPEGVSGLRVLDVGCGNGRSTRMYLDFGIQPGQLTGIDLRRAALELARRSHPGIRFLPVDDGVIPLESGSMDWVSLCTVLSSVGNGQARRRLADEILRVLTPGGFLFYFDRLTAHGFAGGDILNPVALFSGLDSVQDGPVYLTDDPQRLPVFAGLSRLLLPLLRRSIPPATHRACLFRKTG